MASETLLQKRDLLYVRTLLVLLTAVALPLAAQILPVGGFTTELAIATAQGDQDHPSPAASPAEDSRDRVYYPGDTEHVKPLGRKLIVNILLDQKEIWTSPFHMHGGDALWWVGFGAATGALIATDRHTSTVLENSPGQVRWGNNISKIGATYTLIPLVAGFYGYGVLADNPKAREVGVLGAEAMLDSLIVVSVLKPIAGRVRPNSRFDKGEFFDRGGSFPSGHAIEVWSLASVISYEYGHTRIVPIVAYALASVVSVARIGAQQHFASDVLAGGAMGWFIGRYVWKTHQDHALHPHSGLKAHVMPQFAPGSGTYAVAVTFSK